MTWNNNSAYDAARAADQARQEAARRASEQLARQQAEEAARREAEHRRQSAAYDPSTGMWHGPAGWTNTRPSC